MAVDITWNTDGFNELRNSPGVMAALNDAAAKVAAHAGEGFAVDEATEGKTRAHARVYADTFPAKLSQSQDHSIERAVGRG